MSAWTKYVSGRAALKLGDCVEVMRTLPDNYCDSIVTDPPYELGFMGKVWDGTGIAYSPQVWAEALRVLKPGGHLIAFGGTRTSHRLVCAIEDAGFEIRDSLIWLYGQGFPKSLNVGKAIDKINGAEREVVGTRIKKAGDFRGGNLGSTGEPYADITLEVTAPATPEAAQWEGWGTALKPGHEPAVLARKPFKGSVTANVLANGTGALNIDASRIGTELRVNGGMTSLGVMHDDDWKPQTVQSTVSGRWPANVMLSHTPECNGVCAHGCAVAELGEPSRFMYTAKAGSRERPSYVDADGKKIAHATVKPLALMRWLVRMITPPGGICLDPFAGSGSTLEAGLLEGMRVAGIENDPADIPLIEIRLARYE